MSRLLPHVYVHMSEFPIARTKSISDDVNIDYDKDGEIVGIEILAAWRVDIDGKQIYPVIDEEVIDERNA